MKQNKKSENTNNPQRKSEIKDSKYKGKTTKFRLRQRKSKRKKNSFRQILKK